MPIGSPLSSGSSNKRFHPNKQISIVDLNESRGDGVSSTALPTIASNLMKMPRRWSSERFFTKPDHCQLYQERTPHKIRPSSHNFEACARTFCHTRR
jgi:hypothetical protein